MVMARIGLAVLIGLAFLFALNRALMPPESLREAPRARRGVVDLREWSFEKDGVVPLAGEWRMAWNRAVAPDAVDSQEGKSALVPVPGLWSEWSHAVPKDAAGGYCTMWLRVLLPGETPKLRIQFPPFSGAYTLFANGEPIQQTGTFGRSPEGEVPSVKHASAILPRAHGEMLLVLHYSNFQLGRGGIPRPFIVGTAVEVRSLMERRRLIVVFMLGAAFMVGSYHLVLLAIRGRDFSLAWFALLNLALAAHLLFGSDLVPLYAPGFPSQWQLRLDLLSLYAAVPLIILHINEVYPSRRGWRMAAVATGLAAIGAAVAVANPALAQTPAAQRIFLCLALLSLAPSLSGLFVAVRSGMTHPFWLLVCGSAFCGGLIHDALYYEYVVSGPPLWGYGFLVFSLVEAGFIGNRMNAAFLRQRELSQRLLTLNTELEDRVRQRTIELVEVNRHKDRLLSVVAHDMRTPLNGLVKLAEMMRRRPAAFAPDDLSRLATDIQMGARSLLRLVSNLFEWGRLETGTMPCNPCWHSYDLLAEGAAAAFRPVAEAKGITLRIPPSPGLEIHTDADLLRIVLGNLISNGLKFASPGGTVSLEPSFIRTTNSGKRPAAQAGDSDAGQVEVRVTDNGMGMDGATLDAIRREAAVPSRTGTDGEAGHGFGLRICRRCLGLLGAELVVASEPGGFTSFHVTLPGRIGRMAASHEPAGSASAAL